MFNKILYTSVHYTLYIAYQCTLYSVHSTMYNVIIYWTYYILDTVQDNKNIPLCQLYGPVHLLRLITKLGPMLSATSLDKTSLALLLDNVKVIFYYRKLTGQGQLTSCNFKSHSVLDVYFLESPPRHHF